MSSLQHEEVEQTSQQLGEDEEREHQDPFNHYNTEFIKLDSNNWQEETGLCQRPSLNQFVCLKQLKQTASSSYSTSSVEYDENDPFSKMSADSINNKSFTDVTFIVGPPQHSKKYVGHRVLLAMTSPVFETMFYGDMADKNKYIRIPDVAPIGFENLLRFAYTDTLNVCSVEDAMLTAYAAKKYLLPQLLKECLSYIEHNISPSTACVVFEFAHVLNSQQLVLQAMNLIDRQTTHVINNKSFNNVQASTIEFIANRKYLNLDYEYNLIVSILNWALAEANRKNLRQDDWSGSIRSILTESKILSAIRFLSMSQEEFAHLISKCSSKIEISFETKQQAMVSKTGTSSLDDTSGQAAIKNDPSSSSSSSSPNELNGFNTSGDTIRGKVIDVEDSNSLLTLAEMNGIWLNLAVKNIANLPVGINNSTRARSAPPEYFTLKRFKSSSNLIDTTTTTRSIKSITSKFQCLSENLFIVGMTLPIRLDISSYANRTPKLECHLKFTTKQASSQFNNPSTPTNQDPQANPNQQQQQQPTSMDSFGVETSNSTLIMDTIDESLHISIARDKDCLVRLKRPILIRRGNLNELTLTFQTYALDEDLVALRTPKFRSGILSEQTDDENISWLFFKASNIEFSELHYYY